MLVSKENSSKENSSKGNLILTRRPDQPIQIGKDIEIIVIEVKGNQVRLAINAPNDVTVHRTEVYLQIQQENEIQQESQAAANTAGSNTPR